MSMTVGSLGAPIGSSEKAPRGQQEGHWEQTCASFMIGSGGTTCPTQMSDETSSSARAQATLWESYPSYPSIEGVGEALRQGEQRGEEEEREE